MLEIMLRQCGKCLQQKKPNDYVIGTGKTFTIKEFVNKAAKKIGFKIKMDWQRY